MHPKTLYNDYYQIEEEIASGGFATIFRVSVKGSNEQAAVKVGRVDDDPGYTKALREEAKILSRLTHSNIVKLYPIPRGNKEHGGKKPDTHCAQAIEFPGDPVFFVMEYLRGGTLKDYLRRLKSLTAPEAAAIGLEVVTALDYLHKQQYAHNDLKLENLVFRHPIQIGHPFSPVLIDFGIATRVKLRKDAGTTYIMAPEQLSAAPPEFVAALDPTKVDVWGLGVVIYRMLGGRFPFEGHNERTLTDRIISSRPKPLLHLSRDIPPDLNRLVLDGCLAKKPNHRITIREIKRELRPLARGGGGATGSEKERAVFWFDIKAGLLF